MQIEIAKNCGFCFGVRRAVKIAQKASGASTIGELIHNNLEIKRLQTECNVKTLKSIDELTNEKTAIIRTHGITKNDLGKLSKKDIKIIDATCPFVTKPQKIAADMSAAGYEIVYFGDKEHPEAKSVASYATNRVHIVLSTDELENIKLSNKIALISQTTKKIEKYSALVVYLMKRAKEVRVFNTICNATLENQEAAEELARRADIMIVIGGKNSSNTKQLFLISKSLCKDSYHIENADELQKQWFINKKLCGITAGASTPEWIIENIAKTIKNVS